MAWDTSALYTTGQPGVSAVPEPSTSVLVAGPATLGLAVWRRRRKPTSGS
ncbi:MAG: PEP-CTERM sorting domain-containing protein [Opitutae bacterium]|nr:PEP-CTERM sorting domain-containing protein [Opitutae bacterium]